MTSIAVTLLSGGLDSTTVTAYAKKRNSQLTALTFNYGQNHSKEIESAKKIVSIMGIEHKLIEIPSLIDLASYSALINPDMFPIPSHTNVDEIGHSIPITYVPLRNTIFLSLAASFLESKVLQAIEIDGEKSKNLNAHIYMAPNAIDYSGYPDCRPEYFEYMKQSLFLGSKIGTEYDIPIEISTPIISLSKVEIVRMGMRLQAPIEYTWSCYRGTDFPCSVCDSCILRAKGFKEAGIPDPLLLRLKDKKNA